MTTKQMARKCGGWDIVLVPGHDQWLVSIWASSGDSVPATVMETGTASGSPLGADRPGPDSSRSSSW